MSRNKNKKKFKKREALKKMMNEVWNSTKEQSSTALVKVVDSNNNNQPPSTPVPTVTYVKYKRECNHMGTIPIKIGGFDVHLAGTIDGLDKNIVQSCDYIICLNGSIPDLPFGSFFPFVDCTMRDMGGVPEEWETVLNKIRNWIYAGKKIIAYCSGSHGRTGCFAASLIAIMEPDIEDPIEEIRKRHCKKAVETLKQAKAIFALKGMELPEKYEKEWLPKPFISSGPSYHHSQQSIQYPLVSSGYPISDKAEPPVKLPNEKKKLGGNSSTLVETKTLSDNSLEHEDWCCCEPCITRVSTEHPCEGYDNYCDCRACCKEYKLYLYHLEKDDAVVVPETAQVTLCAATGVDVDKCLCNDCLDLYFNKKAEQSGSRDHTHPIGCDCRNCTTYYDSLTEKDFALAMTSSKSIN